MLHRVFPGPLSRKLLVALLVRLVHVGDLRYEGIVRVGVRQQRADTQKHLFLNANVRAYRDLAPTYKDFHMWTLTTTGVKRFIQYGNNPRGKNLYSSWTGRLPMNAS